MHIINIALYILEKEHRSMTEQCWLNTIGSSFHCDCVVTYARLVSNFDLIGQTNAAFASIGNGNGKLTWLCEFVCSRKHQNESQVSGLAMCPTRATSNVCLFPRTRRVIDTEWWGVTLENVSKPKCLCAVNSALYTWIERGIKQR